MGSTKRGIILAVCGICSICFLLYFHGQEYIDETITRKRDQQIVLIILTQTRSGSSFAGEIFAATKNSLYLYEPLYPFSLDCVPYISEKQALLKQLLSCDFQMLNNIYSYGFNLSNWKDGARCIQHGICFSEVSAGLLDSYNKVCSGNETEKFESTSKKCGYPLRADILSDVCESSTLIVTKVTRFCTLQELEDVYLYLKRSNKNVYVLHLVRDLRSITSSHLKLSKHQSRLMGIVNGTIRIFCHRQRSNLEYIKKATRDSSSSIIADGRYSRVRYEDLASNAVGQADAIFKFIGRRIPLEVVQHIQNFLQPGKGVLEKTKNKRKGKTATAISSQYKNPYGVVRDPTKILDEWRNLLPFEVVRQIQDSCGDVMEELGYEQFANEKDVKDLSIPSFV